MIGQIISILRVLGLRASELIGTYQGKLGMKLAIGSLSCRILSVMHYDKMTCHVQKLGVI